MNVRNPLIQGLILIIVLIVGIVVGRFVLVRNTHEIQQSQSSVSISTSTTDTTNQSTTTEQTNNEGVYGFEAQPSTSPATCESTLNASIAKNKTNYEKGTIVVSFIPTRSFDQTKAEIASYGYRIENESSARTSYATTPVVTVVVPANTEVKAICAFRKNEHVKYAGLNTTFELHD